MRKCKCYIAACEDEISGKGAPRRTRIYPIAAVNGALNYFKFTFSRKVFAQITCYEDIGAGITFTRIKNGEISPWNFLSPFLINGVLFYDKRQLYHLFSLKKSPFYFWKIIVLGFYGVVKTMVSFKVVVTLPPCTHI